MSAFRVLLLTDVVDSTRLARKPGDVAFAAVWARHDRLARATRQWAGNFVQSPQLLDQALARELRHRRLQADALRNLGFTLHLRGGRIPGAVLARTSRLCRTG